MPMKQTIVREYDAHLDSKGRITLREAASEYYAVKVYENGRVMLEPRVLVPLELVSKKALKTLDQAARHFKKGKASAPIALKKYL